MPLPSHGPVESFFNSVRAIQCGLRRAADNVKAHCPDYSNEARDRPSFQRMRNGPLKKRRKREANDLAPGLENGSKMPPIINDMWVPIESFLHGANGREDGGILKMEMVNEDSDESSRSSCSSVHCLSLAGGWWMVRGTFHPFKTPKSRSRKQDGDRDARLGSLGLQLEPDGPNETVYARFPDHIRSHELLQLESLLCDVIMDLARNLSWFGNLVMHRGKDGASVSSSSLPRQFHIVDLMPGLSRRKKRATAGFFLSGVGFARVGGTPVGLVDTAPASNDESAEVAPEDGGNHEEDSGTSSTSKPANGLFNIPSNMERLRSVVSNVSNVSLTELIEFIPHLGKPSCDQHPDKKKLFSVQDFFRYTEAEGKHFFEELDRDGDGQVTLEDLHVAMRKRKLPRKYARDLFRSTRRHLFSKSFGWKQFLSLIKQKDPTILEAYTTLCLSRSGTLQKNQILTSLENAGLPASEDNAIAMMRYLNADSGGSISYSHFRNFMLLLPPKRLKEDPRNIWFEAATVVAVPPPVEIPAESVLKSALAGGLASALSTSLLYPIDTMKTRVQASTLTFPEVISTLPDIGIRGLYRGSIPAIIGQFSSHGLRTGIFEASKLILINVAPTLPEIQVQSLASFCSTTLGTAVRIPCEVLKQRLQAGIFDNVGEAVIGTFNHDGFRGFFRGTAATLCREVPFYVAGMGLYAEAKKVAQKLLSRELEPWETVAIGALSGGLAAVVTTPFDVMKTRMMTARPGRPVSIPLIVSSVLRHEGALGLFKGALPRFFWIAPLGAMNFAGYELAKKAMDKPEVDDPVE